MSSASGVPPRRAMRVWEKNLLGMRWQDTPTLIPGLVLVAILAWASILLSEFIGTTLLGFPTSPVSSVMLAILLGLAIAAAVRLPQAVQPGLGFAVKKLLRLGIILLGIRLTIFDVFRLGAVGVPIVLGCIVGALLITTRLNAWLRLPPRLGTLIAAGTAICGVSAIVATAPAIEAEEEEAAYAVAVITIFGLLATLIYPYLAHWLFAGDALQVGLFLGTSVHDTSQVVGAATVYADVFRQPEALDAATITKLVRNVFMALVIPLLAILHARQTQRAGEGAGKKVRVVQLFPLFVLGFLGMAALRSIGDAMLYRTGMAFGFLDQEAWSSTIKLITTWAGYLLVIALAGVGLSTDLRTFRGLGIKPFFVGLGAALAVGVVSFLLIQLLGGLVTL